MPWRAHSHSSRKIRRSAISCPSDLSWSCRMTSARTSLGEVRTPRRARRPAGPSALASRTASSQSTAARAYQRPGPRRVPGQLIDRLEVESKERRESATDVSPRRRRGAPRTPDEGDAAYSCGAYITSLIDCLCRFRSCPRCSSRSPWGWLLARPQTDSSARSTGARGRQAPPVARRGLDRRRAAQRRG